VSHVPVAETGGISIVAQHNLSITVWLQLQGLPYKLHHGHRWGLHGRIRCKTFPCRWWL